MAAQTSLLPVYHNTAQDPKKVTEMNMDVDLSTWMAQEPALQDEAFLQELLSGQGDDLLSTLLEPTPCATNPSSTSIGAPLTFDFDTNINGVLPTSPVGSDSCTSDNYSVTNGGSPLMNVNGVSTDANNVGGVSPPHVTESPNQSPNPFISSTLPMVGPTSELAMDPSLDFSDFSGVDLSQFMTSDTTISSTSLSPRQGPAPPPQSSSSSDVRIDVEPHPSVMRGSVSSDLSAASPLSSTHSPSPLSPSSNSDRKAATLLLTDEEKRLLAAEGVSLPTDMPLTKAEQKQLKRVQRKIKNKISAQESRKRKKNYVEGLEERVKICTDRNQELKREVDCLRSENQSLLSQLKKLQAMFLQYNPSKAQAGTVVMVLILSFSLFLVPKMNYGGGNLALQAGKGFSLHSRSLLFTETDEFGNVVDPESGQIISPYGGQSPSPPFPWIYQTPAVFHDSNESSNVRSRGGDVGAGTEEVAPSVDSQSAPSKTGEHQEVADEL